jgi:hypothetical protein
LKIGRCVTDASSVKDSSLKRKSPGWLQRFELSVAGVSNPKKPACGPWMQSMYLCGHEESVL